MEVTLLTEDTRVHYTGDGVTKEFSYSFNPIDLSYVKVYKNLQQITTPDVTVASGVVTFNVAPAEGDSVVIMREKPLTYDSGIASKGIISSDSLDNMAVDLLGQIQQVNEKLDRVPVYPIDTTMTGEEILNQFNQDVQTVKDSRVEVEGKAEEINNTVSSGLTEISNATSESKSQITEEKNAAITAVETSTAPLIQKAETAASEAEASRANAEEWAKSVDAENIVHRTEDETINGTKTFIDEIIIKKARNATAIRPRSSVIDRDTNDGNENNIRLFWVEDKNNREFAGLYCGKQTDGSSFFRMYAFNGDTNAIFGLYNNGSQSYVIQPTPPSGDNSTKGATTNWVSDPNKSTNVVHRSGNETISGNKTFTEVNTFINGSGNASYVIARSTLIDRDVNPSATKFSSWLIQDKNGKQIANFYVEQTTTGRIRTNMVATGRDGANAVISVVKEANGTVLTYAPTPPTTDNSTQIATTAWVRSSVGAQTGTIIAFAGSSAPTGYLACNGAAVSRTTYSALFNIIGTRWGSGDGSTTFNLPNLNSGRFLRGNSSAGGYNNAGLPNITGSFSLVAGASISERTGAFFAGNSIVADQMGGAGAMTNVTQFSAQKSSSIYGASSTVMPLSANVLFCIKY